MEKKFLRILIATVCFCSVSLGTASVRAMNSDQIDKRERIIRLNHKLNTCTTPCTTYENGYRPTVPCKTINANSSNRGFRCQDCQLTLQLLDNLKK